MEFINLSCDFEPRTLGGALGLIDRFWMLANSIEEAAAVGMWSQWIIVHRECQQNDVVAICYLPDWHSSQSQIKQYFSSNNALR
eukprot:COSAG05_NODE_24216_length_253_cov_0.649351_1_plen_83_part_11